MESGLAGAPLNEPQALLLTGTATMAGRGREDGGNSGRPRRPEVPTKRVGSVTYLRSVVADANAPRRDRGAAARALLNKEARDKKERRMTTADEKWQEV